MIDEKSLWTPSITSRVFVIIRELFGLPKYTNILLTDNRELFAMDSLDDIEFIMAIEDEFGVEISDDEAIKLTNVGDVIDFVTRNSK